MQPDAGRKWVAQLSWVLRCFVIPVPDMHHG